VGGYNPLSWKSYGEIAAISRSNHKARVLERLLQEVKLWNIL
jgi:hypothetical protein